MRLKENKQDEDESAHRQFHVTVHINL